MLKATVSLLEATILKSRQQWMGQSATHRTPQDPTLADQATYRGSMLRMRDETSVYHTSFDREGRPQLQYQTSVATQHAGCCVCAEPSSTPQNSLPLKSVKEAHRCPISLYYNVQSSGLEDMERPLGASEKCRRSALELPRCMKHAILTSSDAIR